MRAFSLFAVALLAGCTFDAEKPDIDIVVNGISQSQNVDHLDVTLTRPDSSTAVYHPQFAPQATGSVHLSLSSGGQTGSFTVSINEVVHSTADTVANPTPLTATFTVPQTAAPLVLTFTSPP
jgi:hypothetical protein